MELTFSDQLRLIAAFYDSHPDLPTPSVPKMVPVFDKEVILAAARLPSAVKVYDDTYLTVTVLVSSNVELMFYISRTRVCEVIATETVLVPAQEPRSYEKPIQWKCHPLLEPSEERDVFQST